MIHALLLAPLLLPVLFAAPVAAQSGLGGQGAVPPPRPPVAAAPAAPQAARPAQPQAAAKPPQPGAATTQPRPTGAANPPRPPAAPPPRAAAAPAAPARPNAPAANAPPPRGAGAQASNAAPGAAAPTAQRRRKAAAGAAAGAAAAGAAGAATAAVVRPPEPEPPPPAAPPKPAVGTVTGLPLPRFAALGSNQVNLRIGPDLRYRIDWTYQRRDLPVQIIEEHHIWRKIRDPEGTEGWVQRPLLNPRRTFLVQGEERALRRRPDADAAPVAHLKPGVIGAVRRCAAGSAWCEVRVGEHEGWIRRADVWGVGADEAIE